MKFPVLETPRLILRAPRRRDLDMAVRALGGKRWASAPLAGAQAWRQIPELCGQWDTRGFGLFAVVPDGCDTPMGLVGPWHPVGWPEPELGWLIWSDRTDREALLAEALHATQRFAANALSWREIASNISLEDLAGNALAVQSGMLADPFPEIPGVVTWRCLATQDRRAA